MVALDVASASLFSLALSSLFFSHSFILIFRLEFVYLFFGWRKGCSMFISLAIFFYDFYGVFWSSDEINIKQSAVGELLLVLGVDGWNDECRSLIGCTLAARLIFGAFKLGDGRRL